MFFASAVFVFLGGGVGPRMRRALVSTGSNILLGYLYFGPSLLRHYPSRIVVSYFCLSSKLGEGETGEMMRNGGRGLGGYKVSFHRGGQHGGNGPTWGGREGQRFSGVW